MVRHAGAWALTLSLVAVLPFAVDRSTHSTTVAAAVMPEQAPAAPRPTQAVQSLAADLTAADPAARATAACELGERGVDAMSAVPSLVALLADDARVDDIECGERDGGRSGWFPDGELRSCATSPARESARALARIGADAVKPLIAALSDVRATMRRYAAVALGLMRDRAAARPAVDRLVLTLGDQDWQVRRSVVWALAEVGGARAATPIAARLREDANPRVRQMAAHGLADLEDPHAAPALVGALKDADWGVRREAVHGLGELHDTGDLDAILGRLDDEHARVREMSAWALGEMGDRRAASALRRALGDREPDVRHQATWALGELKDEASAGALADTLRHDASAEVRHMAAWALGEIHATSAVPALVAALRDDDGRVRDMSAWALGEIGSRDALDGLIAALKDGDWKVRAKAAWAIGEIADRRATEALTASLKDEHPEVRKMAAWALAEVSDH